MRYDWVFAGGARKRKYDVRTFRGTRGGHRPRRALALLALALLALALLALALLALALLALALLALALRSRACVAPGRWRLHPRLRR